MKKINIPNSFNYKSADNSAGFSLYENCLWANLSFTEELLVSICIFGICGFF